MAKDLLYVLACVGDSLWYPYDWFLFVLMDTCYFLFFIKKGERLTYKQVCEIILNINMSKDVKGQFNPDIRVLCGENIHIFLVIFWSTRTLWLTIVPFIQIWR